MMRRYLIVGLFVLSAGCATTAQVRADLEEWKSGLITNEELQTRLEEHGDSAQEKMRGWVELALTVAAAFWVPGTAIAVNMMRNRDIFTKGTRVPTNAHIEVPVTPAGLVAATGVAATVVKGATATVEAGNAVKV